MDQSIPRHRKDLVSLSSTALITSALYTLSSVSKFSTPLSSIYLGIVTFTGVTLRGEFFYHFATEAITGYLLYVSVPRKSQADTWTAAGSIVKHLNQFRFVASEFCTDSEATYMTLKEFLGDKGIEHDP